MEKRRHSPKHQAKVQQYRELSGTYEEMGAVLIQHYAPCRLKEARFFYGDDWSLMLAEFERYVLGTFPDLFAPAAPAAPEVPCPVPPAGVA